MRFKVATGLQASYRHYGRRSSGEGAGEWQTGERWGFGREQKVLNCISS